MLIGICGPKRHGKDTVGTLLMGEIPELTRFAFADKLKYLLRMCMNPEESMEANKDGRQHFKTSELAIRTSIGVAIGDALKHYGVSKDYAVETFIYTLRHHTKNFKCDDNGDIEFDASWRTVMQYIGTEWGRNCITSEIWVSYLPIDNVVVTDVRYDGEAKAILAQGGIVVDVHDPRKEADDSHVSESGISDDLITTYIVNDGTLEDLKRTVKSFVRSYEEMLWL